MRGDCIPGTYSFFMRKYYQHTETDDDGVLVKELQKGNLQSFNALYYKYYPSVFANICRLIKKQEDAEEILQDVFVSLWDKRATLNPDLSIGGWLMVGVDVNLENGSTGGAITVLPSIKKTFNEGRDYLFPLPTQELLLNKQLKQNPNW